MAEKWIVKDDKKINLRMGQMTKEEEKELADLYDDEARKHYINKGCKEVTFEDLMKTENVPMYYTRGSLYFLGNSFKYCGRVMVNIDNKEFCILTDENMDFLQAQECESGDPEDYEYQPEEEEDRINKLIAYLEE